MKCNSRMKLLKPETVRRRLAGLRRQQNIEYDRHAVEGDRILDEIDELRSRCPHINKRRFYCIYESPSIICDDCDSVIE